MSVVSADKKAANTNEQEVLLLSENYLSPQQNADFGKPTGSQLVADLDDEVAARFGIDPADIKAGEKEA